MQSSNQLQDMLRSINRKSYPAYKSLKGAYQFNKYVLSIDHAQGDPFGVTVPYQCENFSQRSWVSSGIL